MGRVSLLLVSILILTPRLLEACPTPLPGETRVPIFPWTTLGAWVGAAAILVVTLIAQPRPYGRLRAGWTIACVGFALHPVWTMSDLLSGGDCGLLLAFASILCTVVIAALCLMSLSNARREARHRAEAAA